MSTIDGVGEIVTGGLIASAVETAAGGDGPACSGPCLNCGSTLTGAYCSSCGQKALVPRSLLTFFHDMAQGLFNIEGKIWRTLPMLAWRPGEMTRCYIEGQRARFVSPIALYLFSVFVMFAVLNFTGTITPNTGMVSTNLNVAAASEKAELAKLEVAQQSAIRRGVDPASIKRQIASKADDIRQLERLQHGEIVRQDQPSDNQVPRWVRGALVKIQRDPHAFLLKVQDATSKFSWLLIPLSVPFLWLLFPFNRRFRLYDHTVFVTYSLSFMMMLVITGGLLVSFGASSIASFLFFLPPLHMYRQLRGAYGLTRMGALWRTVALVSFAFVASILFFLAMVAIGLID